MLIQIQKEMLNHLILAVVAPFLWWIIKIKDRRPALWQSAWSHDLIPAPNMGASLSLHFSTSNHLLINGLGKAVQNSTSAWATANHVADPGKAPGFRVAQS